MLGKLSENAMSSRAFSLVDKLTGQPKNGGNF